MLRPELEVVGDRRFLKTSTAHGSYDQIQTHGGETCLLMNRTNFVIGVHDTLPFWTQEMFPKVFRSASDVLSSVVLSHAKDRPQLLPTRIRLNHECTILTSYNEHIVTIPLEHFARYALTHLAEHPQLDLGSWDNSSCREFEFRMRRAHARLCEQMAA